MSSSKEKEEYRDMNDSAVTESIIEPDNTGIFLGNTILTTQSDASPRDSKNNKSHSKQSAKDQPFSYQALWTYQLHDFKTNKMTGCIAISSIAIVVGFVSLLICAVKTINPLFLSINEASLSGIDMILMRHPPQGLFKSLSNKTVPFERLRQGEDLFIDTQAFEKTLSQMEDLVTAFPRWLIPAQVSKKVRKENSIETLRFNSIIISGDSKKENKAGLGSLLNLPALEANEAYVSADLLELAGLEEGQSIELAVPWLKIIKDQLEVSFIDDKRLIDTIVDKYVNRSSFDDFEIEMMKERLMSQREFYVKFTVKTAIDDAKGKWPSIFSNVVFADVFSIHRKFKEEIRYMFSDLLAFNPDRKAIFDEYLDNKFDMVRYSMTFNFVVKHKTQVYDDYLRFPQKLGAIADKFMENILNPTTYNILDPNSKAFKTLGFLAMFLENIILCIVAMISIIGYFVLSSLSTLNTEQKTYQFAMLRAIGAKKNFIVLSLLLQCGMYCSIGTSIGLFINYLCKGFIKQLVIDNTGYPEVSISLNLSNYSLIFFLGIVLPFISTVSATAKSFLSVSLLSALKNTSSQAALPTVNFKRLSDYSFSPLSVVLGLELFVLGMIFYYFAPLSFYKKRMDVFLGLMSTVFMCAIVATVVLGGRWIGNFQNYIIKLIKSLQKNSWLDLVIGPKVTQNMRNVWVVVAFAVCFIIAASSGLSSQLTFLQNQIIQIQGTDLVVTATGYLNEYELRKLLQSDQEFTKIVESFSFMSSPLSSLSIHSEIRPPASENFIKSSIVGIDKDFMKTIRNEYYNPGEYIESEKESYGQTPYGEYDGIASIFKEEKDKIIQADSKQVIVFKEPTPAFKVRVIRFAYPTGLVRELASDFNKEIDLFYGQRQTYFGIAKPTHTANKVPGAAFSRYKTTMKAHSNVLISMDSMAWLLEVVRKQTKINNEWVRDRLGHFRPSFDNEITKKSTLKVPKNKLLLRLKDDHSKKLRTRLKSELNILLGRQDIIFDSFDMKKGLGTLIFGMKILSIVDSVLFSLLALFLMLLGTLRRISESLHEIGILRSVGMSSSKIISLFKMETAIGLLSSILIGIILGLGIALIGCMASMVFFENNLVYMVPWGELLILIVLLLASAYFASHFSLVRLHSASISRLLKGRL